MKFYRYIIYRLYDGLNKNHESHIEILSTIALILAIILFFQLLTIYAFFLKLFPQISIFHTDYKIYGLVIYFFLVSLYFIFLSRKNRLENYYEEFKDESRSSKIKGTLLLVLYYFGSFALLVLVLILLFNR